jgi:hypothetical protein
VFDAAWIRADQEQRALTLAAEKLVPEHFQEVVKRRVEHVDKTLLAVHERLTKEIAFWSDRWLKLKEDQEAGKDVRLNLDNARRMVTDLQGRLENRKKELNAMRHVMNAMPVVLGGALVIPIGLLRTLRGEPAGASTFSPDPAARIRIAQMAMDAVRRAEEARGCRVVDVSEAKCGWDLTSYPPVSGTEACEVRHIEVKGRAKAASVITVSRNEIIYGCNQGEKFVLAVVLVGENDSVDGPHYIRNPFDREPGWGVSSVNYNISDLLQRAEAQ